MAISADEKEILDECLQIISPYERNPQFLLAMMQDVQKHFNYLPRAGMKLIAEYVNVPFSRVYAMASFYKAFSLFPKGKYKIKVCDGTACHIKGSPMLLEQLYKHLGIHPGETSPDGEFSLETVNCLGACALAPVMLVNEKVYGNVTPASIEEIIKEYGGTANGADD